MSFRIHALPLEPFAPLFALSDDALRAHGARRVVADGRPVYPCRVSLRDAAEGERLVLLHHEHQSADTPYRAAGPIYVREAARVATPQVDEVPQLLRSRLLSLRAYDTRGMMVWADVRPARISKRASPNCSRSIASMRCTCTTRNPAVTPAGCRAPEPDGSVASAVAVVAEDDPRAALVAPVRLRPVDQHHERLRNPIRKNACAASQNHQASRPENLKPCRSTTAAMRPIVARLPKSR